MANSPETDALREDLEQLRKDFSALSEKYKQSSYSQARAGMDKARDSVNSLCEEVEARPCASLVTAFGLGLLLGKIFSR